MHSDAGEEPDNRRKHHQLQQQNHSKLVRGPLKDSKKKCGKNERNMDFSPVPLKCLFILLVNVAKISECIVCEVSELLLSIYNLCKYLCVVYNMRVCACILRGLCDLCTMCAV